MNIYQAIKDLPWRKRIYFIWKHGLERDAKAKKLITEEDFLNYTGSRSLNQYRVWEQSEQYKNLVAILLQSRVGNDLWEVYQAVSEKAKKGDSKAIDTLLRLQKEINEHYKEAVKDFKSVKIEEDEDDELEI
ncbi:hypothetical protein BSNK01_22610 [Bacillaceae bacterium]